MARIRTVKPDLFRHEGLFEAEKSSGLPLRVAFIGLWTVADREGRFNWRPRALKLDVLPFDDSDFSSVLDALEIHGFIYRYEEDGKLYGFIPSWLRHQVINTREAKSVIPPPPEGFKVKHVHAPAFHADTSAIPRGINIPSGIRDTVYARDENQCCRCGRSDDLTIDHIFPQSMGGTHALTNLRTLCRPCNSARPVQGRALIDDLEADGLTMGDMQRMCMHVHVTGEGKGREGNRKGKEEERNAHDMSFAEFWKAYPKKKGKAPAEQIWRRLRPDGELVEKIMDALAIQANSNDWIKNGGQYVPNPATWLNQKRWDDEVKHDQQGTSGCDSGLSLVDKVRERNRINAEREDAFQLDRDEERFFTFDGEVVGADD